MVKDKLLNNKYAVKLLLLGIYLLGTFTSIYFLNGLRTELLLKSQNIKELKNDIAALDRMQTDHENNKEKILNIVTSLPDSYFEIGTLAYKIEEAAKLEGLTAVLEFEEESVSENGYTTLNVTAITKGGYQDYSFFLDNVLGLPYNMTTEKIAYETVKNELIQSTTFKIYIKK